MTENNNSGASRMEMYEYTTTAAYKEEVFREERMREEMNKRLDRAVSTGDDGSVEDILEELYDFELDVRACGSGAF